jgi:SOS response regulatory protein OraA/RecX
VRIVCLRGNARRRRSCARHGTRPQRLGKRRQTFDTGFQRDTKALEMNADVSNHLADRSRAAQVITSCLHVGALSDSESARTLITRRDVAARAGPPPP